MTTIEKTEVALEAFASEKSVRELGISLPELVAIRDRITTVITEMEQAAMRVGFYEVNGRRFKEPVKGPASSELQAEIDIHNEHTGDNKTKTDYLMSVVGE